MLLTLDMSKGRDDIRSVLRLKFGKSRVVGDT